MPSDAAHRTRSADADHQAVDEPSSGRVTEADVSFDESGEPQTGPRSVPIPRQLVDLLRVWVDEHGTGPDDLLFRTRTGRRPTSSNWSRAFQRALAKVGRPPMRIYVCRHAAATTWLRAGVPLGEVAKRMGHSVETLVSTYVGALDGDEAVANVRIEAVLAGPAKPSTVRRSGRRKEDSVATTGASGTSVSPVSGSADV